MRRAASVLLDEGINRPLDYLLEQDVSVGTRVSVPLRGRTVKGTIIALKDEPEVASALPIESVLENEAALPSDLFKLAEWMSQYYVTPLRRVVRLMLPAPLRGKAKVKTQLFVKHKTDADTVKALRQKSPAQARVLDVLLQRPKGLLLTELLELSETSRAPIDSLAKKKLIAIQEVTIDRSPFENIEFFPTQPKQLLNEQATTLQAITKTFDAYSTHLIHGITGSGKTEIYLQAIDAALKQNRGIILLVPEIALTTQTIERLKSRIPVKAAILHHRLSDGERYDAWQSMRRGDIRIAIGARSALFSPIQNLGLIIVDEEHESSYKQEEAPCYHARNVAIMRAHLSSCPCVLGSATPSIETYQNALNGKYQLHSLTKRATGATLPSVQIIDLNQNKTPSIFSDQLLSAIEKRLASGEQTLLFLNRRGYHPLRICSSCKEPVKCSHCDVALTFHKKENTLFCHSCGYHIQPPPKSCPYCHASESLQYRGAGTEQVERTLHAIFPDIRTLRMDADTTRHKGSHDTLFKQFRAGKADVLIGTQMIAKGLHFPSVTLVGVLNSDAALTIPDFRASENVFQLLAQVSGRSGRGELPGSVIIQTRHPDHPTILHASREDYHTFFNEELSVRKLFDYPPYTRLARFLFTGTSDTATRTHALNTHAFLASNLPPSLLLLPVTPCGCAKIKERYRFQFLIKGPSFTPLSSLRLPHSRHVRTLIDIDPHTTY